MSALSFPSISKNGGVFFASLIFAFVLWFLFYFSRDFTQTITLPIALVFDSRANIHKTSPIHFISVKVHGRGWLLNQFENNTKDPIVINVGIGGQKVLKLKPYMALMNREMPPGLLIEDIMTEAIWIQNTQEINKKVPLRLKFQLNFQKQYYFSTPTRISPDSITLTGSPSLLHSISTWELPDIILNAVHKSVDTTVSLYKSRFPDISVNPSSTNLQIHVDRFTESVLNLPIKILNPEEGKNLTLIPSHVEIRYLVPLSYYSSVREDLFEAQVNLEEWKQNKQIHRLKIAITRSPDFVRVVKLSPILADFIIYP